MKRSTIPCVMFAAALALSAGLSLATENKGGKAGDAKAASGAQKTEKGGKATKPAAKVKLVDINSAGKAELKTLPGIGDAEADKIIAGRPYLSKANLATHDILPRETYEGLKSRVSALPNKASEAKFLEKQKAAMKPAKQ